MELAENTRAIHVDSTEAPSLTNEQPSSSRPEEAICPITLTRRNCLRRLGRLQQVKPAEYLRKSSRELPSTTFARFDVQEHISACETTAEHSKDKANR